jgi:RAB protein geranylgeranyltransferase component A
MLSIHKSLLFKYFKKLINNRSNIYNTNEIILFNKPNFYRFINFLNINEQEHTLNRNKKNYYKNETVGVLNYINKKIDKIKNYENLQNKNLYNNNILKIIRNVKLFKFFLHKLN